MMPIDVRKLNAMRRYRRLRSRLTPSASHARPGVGQAANRDDGDRRTNPPDMPAKPELSTGPKVTAHIGQRRCTTKKGPR